jgi:hypothetical protein
MEFVYVTAFAVRGVLPPDKNDLVLVDRLDKRLKMTFTFEFTGHTSILDRQLALGTLMLKALVGVSGEATFEQRLQQEIEAIQDQRRREVDNRPIALIEIHGDTEVNLNGPMRDCGEFLLCFDAVDRDAIRDHCRGTVTALLTAFTIGTNEYYEFQKVAEGAYLVDLKGRIIHSFSATIEGDAIVSRQIESNSIDAIRMYSGALLSEMRLGSVARLLVQALDGKADRLRRFVAGWTALEMLVSKVFSSYEKTFLRALIAASPVQGAKRYFERIQDVMKDKYRLLDKFGVVSALLDPKAAENDVRSFKKVKEIRDRHIHGEDVPETSLPNNEVVALLRKYFRLHVESAQVLAANNLPASPTPSEMSTEDSQETSDGSPAS